MSVRVVKRNDIHLVGMEEEIVLTLQFAPEPASLN